MISILPHDRKLLLILAGYEIHNIYKTKLQKLLAHLSKIRFTLRYLFYHMYASRCQIYNYIFPAYPCLHCARPSLGFIHKKNHQK